MSPIEDVNWWDKSEWEKHLVLLPVAQRIRQAQEFHRFNNSLNSSLYSGRPSTGYGSGWTSRASAMSARVSLNVIRNMVGAVTSKIASKSKPKPRFIADDADYDARQLAEAQDRFVEGVFYDSKIYQTVVTVFRDACVYGTGFLKLYDADGQVHGERVRPTEVLVDELEGRDGNPSNIYQQKLYDRAWMRRRWAVGSRAEEIDSAILRAGSGLRSLDESPDLEQDSTSDLILVTEAWHLGEGRDQPGRHVVCVEGCTLLDEEWKGPFQILSFRWSEDPDGYFGIGLAEELRGVQAEINQLLKDIQKAHHLVKGHYLVQGEGKVTSQINNDLASIVRYSGAEPKYVAPTAIAPDVYNHLWQLYAKAYEISGISQMSASGARPAGLNSGEAQRVYNDIQSERFLEVGQRFEEFVVEVAREVVRCAQRIGGSYRVRSVGADGYEEIKWSEVAMDPDKAVIRVYPTSTIPSTVAGKTEWAETMISKAQIPPEDILDILDIPDTRKYVKRATAPRRIIERNLSTMLREGKMVSPEPNDNHVLALRLVNEAYHEARLMNVPEKKLQLLRDYMAITKSRIPAPPEPSMAPTPPTEPAMPIDPAMAMGPAMIPPEGALQ